MKIKILLFFLLGIYSIINAQKFNKYASVDEITARIPDSLTTTSKDIANYIDSKFKSDESKLRAVYMWVAKNIHYDIENMYSLLSDTCDIVINTLKTRKGICDNYAELFVDIARNVNIKSFIVNGYTKSGRNINSEPHSWCVAMIDSVWYIFDPTWGSGFIRNMEYVKQINDEYFKIYPKQAIKSHMPFDPLWQFLYYPITNLEFSASKYKQSKSRKYFNFIDSLKIYESQSEVEQLKSTIRRFQANVINSYLLHIRVNQLKAKVDNFYFKSVVKKYNSAVKYFNESIFLMNRFIDYRNNHFSPYKSDSHIKQMLDSIENILNLAIESLDAIQNPNTKSKNDIDLLYKSIEGIMDNLNKQKKFLTKFLKTEKQYRKSLFYDRM